MMGLQITVEKFVMIMFLKDTRIKCFHQINQGVGAARNKGLEVAEGDLLAL